MNIANATDPVSFHMQWPTSPGISSVPKACCWPNLDRDQKVTLLRQWDQDSARQPTVAAEENMPPEGADRTGDQLRPGPGRPGHAGRREEEDGPPTKTGG